MRAREFYSLIGAAASGWVEDNALRLSAALAYYSIFSLAPLLIILLAVAGFFFGEAAARGQIAEQIKQLAGARAAEAVQTLLLSINRRHSSFLATVFGIVALLFGASGVFSELKAALNTIWGVGIKPGSALGHFTRERFISFAMVLAVGFLLLLSLLVSAALTALGIFMDNLLPLPGYVLQCADFAVSLAVITVLFAMLFKMLPNVLLRWRDVWVGAAGTAFLFTAGKFLIGLYLGTSGVASYYGAAGSAIVILLWVYYSACILFFGAEFTKAFVRKYGAGIQPDKRAALLVPEIDGGGG
jgi:membrane protein